MNKFFHKTLQHSVGITGLAIVYLGISLVPDFLYNLWTFALSHPLSGGLATGLPLIPLLMSSKQKRTLQYTDVISHTDVDASAQYIVNTEFDHFLAGWVQKVSYSFAYDIAFNQITTIVGWSYVKDDMGGISNIDIDDYNLLDISNQSVSSTVSYNRMPVRPFLEVADPNNSGDTISKHTVNMMDWVQPGDTQVIQLAAQGMADPTGGSVTIRMEIVVIIAAFGAGRSKKQGSAPNYLVIVGNLDGAENVDRHTIIPETDMRLFSISALWYQVTMDDEAYLALYQGELDVVDLVTTDASTVFTDVLRNIKNMFFLGNDPDHSSDTTLTNQDQFLGMTKFQKGPIFMKKAQPWSFETNNESGNEAYFIFTAQVMPDYQNAVDWNLNMTPDISGDGWTYFTIPYDIYVTRIHWDYKFTVLSSQTGNTDVEVYIQGIKSGQATHTTDASFFLGYPNSSTAQDFVRTAALENIYITAPPADVYGGGVGKTTSYSNSGVTEVNDYYERGSKIGIANMAISTISDLGFMLQIEGVVAKKTGKRDSLAYKVENPELLNVVTGEAAT